MKNRKTLIFKASTTLVCFLIALLNASGVEWLIVFGLFLGIIGDIFLEFENKFLHGMIAFLIGHIFYSIGFGMKFSVPGILTFAVVYIVLLFIYFGVLYKHIGIFKIPILVYVLTIGTMFSFTFSPIYKEIYFLRFLLPLAGGLFVLSDFLIAINKFVKKIPASNVIILSTYFLAQLIISLSTIF